MIFHAAKMHVDFGKCPIGLNGRIRPRSSGHVKQLAVPAAVALGLGFQRTRLALQDDHVVQELDRNPELRRCRPVRMTFLNKIKRPADAPP